MASKDIQAAIEKARAVAAKLSQQLPDSGKRPADSSNDGPAKKFASVNDAVGAQLAMLKAQQLGGSSAPTSGSSSEEMKVPDKLVGLVIGKGGDQLHRLQSETQTKIIIAPDANGQSDRTFTLVGTKENIERCKKLINDIIKRGANPSPNDPTQVLLLKGNLEVYEMKLPGNKCGLIIGKGGETIKKLSEQYGVKLVVIQDANTPLTSDKPLRITGEPEKVARAREAVLSLINPKEVVKSTSYSTNEYGSKAPGSGGDVVIKVPADKAGVVIGKGGESIKEINRRSGAHVEIDKNHKNLPEGHDKMFVIKGTPEQIQYAQQLIYEKITGVIGSVPPQGYFGPQAADMSSMSAYSAADSTQAWAGYGWPAADPTKTADATAAWAAYYQQYYGTAAAAAASPAAGTTTATAASNVNPQTGQADYSQAWIEYYRSLGMHEQAEAIQRQIQQNQTNGTSGTNGSSSPNSQQPVSATSTNGTSVPATTAEAYASQAAAWQQYSQYNYANYYKQESESRNG